ncbi:MAG: hemolysin III family protein [Clostridia bacterium]|nr:hemolysin III family protein [Clostridia bacterium]
MIGKDVKPVEYSRKIDFFNSLTHAVGAVLSVVGLIMLTLRAEGTRYVISAVVYGAALVSVYTISTVYHALSQGESKRRMRMVDHATVPFLIAGTATPCALISLYEVKPVLGILVFSLGWLCAFFGFFSKLFFFEKLKAVTMAVYMVSGFIMLCSVIPVHDRINMGAFSYLVYGCVFYVIGAILCGLGVKRPWLHVVFHVFVLLGSAFHFYVIYSFVIK